MKSNRSDLQLAKILYIEPVEDAHWNAAVLEHLVKPLKNKGYIVDFTVCCDHLFAMEQLHRVDFDIFMVHDKATPHVPVQFCQTLRALGIQTPVVLVEDNDTASSETLKNFASHLVKPVDQQQLCDVIFDILELGKSS